VEEPAATDVPEPAPTTEAAAGPEASEATPVTDPSPHPDES